MTKSKAKVLHQAAKPQIPTTVVASLLVAGYILFQFLGQL